MASAHTFVARFKPHSFGHAFELWEDGIYYCDPRAAVNVADGATGKHTFKHLGNMKALTNVTVTMGVGNVTIEIKDGVAWTFGVVKVSKFKRTEAAAFKVLVDAAVAAYVAP